MSLTRKQFLSLVASSLAVSTVACGDDEDSAAGPSATSTTTSANGGSGGTTTTSGGGMGGSGNAGGMGGNGVGGNGGAGGSAAMCTADVTADIGDNHGHELTVPLTDIMAGVDVTYTTTGSANHTHMVTVTAADFITLRSGGSVVLKSCSQIPHEYVLNCAGNGPTPMTPSCP